MSDLDRRLDKLSPEKRALVLQQLRKKKASERDASKIIRKRVDGSIYPLSYAQQRMWFLNQWEPDNPLYNITAAVRINGDLNINAFTSSIEEVVHRHEVLRAYFVPGDDGYPVQKIHQGHKLALTTIDIQDLPPGEIDQELTRLIQKEALKPFDLTVYPLIRGSIIQVGNTERIVLLTIHHIVADGWSVGVFIQEVASLYEASVTDRPSPLPEIDVQYADFAAWQKEWMHGEVLELQLAYWLDRFQEIPPPLELPTDRPRPAVQTFEGAVEIIRIPKDVVEGVRDIGKRENASLFMTLLTAFYIILHRYSGQDEICIGSPISNRGRIEIERLIGLFVNTLALKADLTGSPSFIDLLNQVKETTLSGRSSRPQ